MTRPKMSLDQIVVRGARKHNLKGIDVTIPRNKFVIITGVSGSGKSTLAFDTIYAEGQRRYVESLSAYARQFLGRMEKPEVDYIEGLSPAISIDQKGVSHNPRSTVGTVTEIYDYLRLLFARVGIPHCYKCGREVAKRTVQQITDSIKELPNGTKLMITAPKIIHRKGEHREVIESIARAGFVRVLVDGEIVEITDPIKLERNKWHDIYVVVDRIVVNQEMDNTRIAGSVETALKQGSGVMKTVDIQTNKEIIFSENFSCVYCDVSMIEIEPRTFSFNNPHGACSVCTGLGYRLEVSPALVVPNKDISLRDGAIAPWSRSGMMNRWHSNLLDSLASKYGFSLDTPISSISDTNFQVILYGTGDEGIKREYRTRRGRRYRWSSFWEGVIPNLERRYKETHSDYSRREIERYMAALPCQACNGNRLRPESMAVKVVGKNIVEISNMSIKDCFTWVRNIGTPVATKKNTDVSSNETLTVRNQQIAGQILKEIEARLEFLIDIGLEYLTIDRAAGSLSGGEAQRIRLATQIGSGLVGVLYVCDEPTIGLHPLDNEKLIDTLKQLRDLGNTVLVVEHDEAVMRSADYIIDLGIGAGDHGGEVVVSGNVTDVETDPNSVTGAYLSKRRSIVVPPQRRNGRQENLIIKGARANNLRNIDVAIPLGKFVCVTGVSGSGKSTLINEILYKYLAFTLLQKRDTPGQCDRIEGIKYLDKVINIDQAPIGRTPRSNPATYTGVFTPIRELFSSTPDARARGYLPGRFSFNVKGGRCEACDGAGFSQIEMHFLPDVTVPCDICQGKRYNREALEIMFKEKNIADVLGMTVTEALDFFANIPKIKRILETISDVGLGYIRLGQPATTLSGGEAQRIKLATELSRRPTGKTIYLLDEPTTGLSFQDCDVLLKVLHRLVDAGNSVVLIEHNLDIVKNADWVIDLGPGAGVSGGTVVAEGTPEKLIESQGSVTGVFLKRVLHES